MKNEMKKDERSPNDQRSDVKNENNLEYQKDKVNTEKQLAKDKKLDSLADFMIDHGELYVGNDW